jgi:hypothetical protein
MPEQRTSSSLELVNPATGMPALMHWQRSAVACRNFGMMRTIKLRCADLGI